MLRKVLVFVTIILISLASFSQISKLSKEKYAKGIRFTGPDSSFYVKFGLRMQNLVVVTAPEDGPAETRALVRRFRFKFDGWILNPDFVYKVEVGQSNIDVGGGSNLLLDAVLKYHAGKNLWIWFGQTKLPGNRERVVSSQTLETVDRSALNSAYNVDRDMGLQLRHSMNLGEMVIREAASVSGGEGRNWSVGNSGGLCYTGRIEILPFGNFSSKGDYFLADLKHEQNPKFAFGATYDLNDLASKSKGQRGTELQFQRSLNSYMADMIFKFKGFSVFSEFIRKETNDPYGTKEKLLDPTITGTFTTGYGFNGQAGYVTKSGWGAVGRFTNVTPDSQTLLTENNQYTLAFSKYIVNHKFKIQTDGTYIDNLGAKANVFMWRFHMEVGF